MPEIRLIDEDGAQLGILSTRDALQKAQESGLDLILISPQAKPPVCRLGDYGKIKYEQSKKEKEARKASKPGVLKELKLSVKIDKHDLEVRINHAREFLEKRHKVKFVVFMRGREISHKDIAFNLLKKLIEALADCSQVEMGPKEEGRSIILLVGPRAKEKKNAQDKNAQSSSQEIQAN